MPIERTASTPSTYAGSPSTEDRERAARGPARRLRAPRTPGERRVEFPGGVHPSRRPLRPVPPGRLGAVGCAGGPEPHRRRADGPARPATPGRGPGRPGLPRAPRTSSRRRWATWSRPSASCRPASRRSKHGWPREDRPVEGAAWLVPARELGSWAGPVAAHLLARTPGGDLVHADCGEGDLLAALDRPGRCGARGRAARRGGTARARARLLGHHRRGVRAPGRPAGGIARGHRAERGGRPPAAARPALRSWRQCRRTLGRDAPLVVVAEPAAATESWDAPALDLVQGRPVHEATWELLLDRAGFVEVAPLDADAGNDRRFALAAATPS